MGVPMKRNMVAFDCGNSSFRVVLGSYDGNKVITEVISQVPNYMVKVHGYFYWDILMIYHKLLEGLKKAVEKAGTVDSIGICTWGVDFGLFDRQGLMVQNPLSYRNEIGARMLHETPLDIRERLYRHTGVLCDKINSVYMIKGMMEKMPEAYARGDRLLMIPDILNYMFTGHMLNEPSELSTTQLMDAKTRSLSREALADAGISEEVFAPIGVHGTKVGMIHQEIKDALGVSYDIPVICVPSHDTAAAVLAIPAKEDEFLFISSGTWALIGMELGEPVVGEDVKKRCLTNEVGAFDKITLLRNSAGMFLIQRLRDEYEREHGPVDWESLNALGDEYKGTVPLFDVNDQRFFNPVHMGEEIWKYFRQTGQADGDKDWNAIICSFQHSMAMSFAVTIKDLEEVSGKKRDTVYMVGGGSKNIRLCQMTADAAGKRVVTGGKESTSLGNLGAQIKYFEPEKTVRDLRKVMGNSIESTEYRCKRSYPEELERYQILLG